MGAWTFVHGRLHRLLAHELPAASRQPCPLGQPGDGLECNPPVGAGGHPRPIGGQRSGLSAGTRCLTTGTCPSSTSSSTAPTSPQKAAPCRASSSSRRLSPSSSGTTRRPRSPSSSTPPSRTASTPPSCERFEQAVLRGEYVHPPAGAIGRGDAFLLRVAEKVDGTVLSNDSFQEFHGEHPWLFERGRLLGGTPVPGIGWIFSSPPACCAARAATRPCARQSRRKRGSPRRSPWRRKRSSALPGAPGRGFGRCGQHEAERWRVRQAQAGRAAARDAGRGTDGVERPSGLHLVHRRAPSR